MTGRSRQSDKGFTLPELLVTGLIFLILVLTATVILRPDDHGAQQRNGVRWTSVAALKQGLKLYIAEHGRLPENIPAKQTMMSSEEGGYDLCPELVPFYMDDMPLDPQIGAATSEESCITSGVVYVSGYTIQLQKDGSVTIAAPQAEAGEKISETVRL